MRVQLTGRARDQRGAIAVMAGLLAVVLLVLAAFTLDFGLAFNSKRQLQTASDSAALAGAEVYSRHPGACTSAFIDAYEAQARAAAEVWTERNRPNASLVWSKPTCVNGSPQVTATTTGETSTIFGSLATGSDTISTQRSAASITDVPQRIGQGLRPLALCSAQIPAGPYGVSQVPVNVYFPGGGHQPPPQCPATVMPGNWWLLDCPGERTGSASQLEQQVLNGCPDPVSVVPGSGSITDPEQLTVRLEEECPTAPQNSEMCMSGNPGNITQGHIENSWTTLINTGEPIIMPVFCVPPQCSESTVDGNGTSSVFPVSKLAGVTVCGYHYAGNKKYAPAASAVKAPCTAGAANSLRDDSSNDSYLSLVFTTMRVQGSTSDIGVCAVGTRCDGGLRRVAMVD